MLPVPVGFPTVIGALLATAAALTGPAVPVGTAAGPRTPAVSSGDEVVTPLDPGPTVERGVRGDYADVNIESEVPSNGHVAAVCVAVLQVRKPSTRSPRHSVAI